MDFITQQLMGQKMTEDQDECEHSDKDKGICLDCGLDLREDIMARAYDDAKDRRKYGE